MFTHATALLQKGLAEQAVCLMDLPDDWGMEYQFDLYEETFDAAIAFSLQFSNTLWCYGNHDLSYEWNKLETGFSPLAHDLVCKKIVQLKNSLDDISQIAYIHRIDQVLFSHAGLTEDFVGSHVSQSDYSDVNTVVSMINQLRSDTMWNDASPIWVRPQYNSTPLYEEERFLQVVGHTPVTKITKTGSLISCDTFSTYQDHTPIRDETFLLLDTKNGNWRAIQ